MKKILFTIALILSVFIVNAQTLTTSKDQLAWLHVSPSTLSGYDVAFCLTSVTAAQLGNSNTISNTISTFRVIGGNTLQTAVSNIVPVTTAPNVYNLWIRAVSTNTLLSGWTNITIQYSVPPQSPTTVSIIRIP